MVTSVAQPVGNRLPLPFASYETRPRRGIRQRLINCYAEQGQTKGEIILRGTFGKSLLTTLDEQVQRGAIEFQEKLYVVGGDSLYEVAENGTATVKGTIPGTGYCPMAHNGSQLVILAPPAGYIFDGSTVTQITDSDFTARGAIDCVFNGNYILFVEPNSGRFFGSELGDASAYDPLDFATAEGSPDNLVGLGSDHGDVFLAGKKTCEIWGNVGGSGFPFSRRFNGVIEQGCGAGQSIVNADQTIFWIDETRIARRLDGVTPVRVSQHGVEAAWQDYSTIEDCEGYSYTQDGHIFIVWNFPTANATWVYDVVTRQWHERQSYPNAIERSRWCLNVYEKVLCGDRSSGKIGEMAPNVWNEYGDDLVASWLYPTVYAENDTALHHQLDIVAETGRGKSSGGSTPAWDSDPHVMLEVSDDGGLTFEHVPPTALGQEGQYKTMVTWNGLGSSRDRIYRASISADVERAVYQTHIRATGGNF